MRHHVAKVRLSRPTSHRIALMRNLVTSLIEAERIETTLAKAKQLRRLADRAVTWGKEGTLQSRRRALAVIRKKMPSPNFSLNWRNVSRNVRVATRGS